MQTANGDGLSLSERVRSLRLPDKANEPKPFPMLPWLLVFVLTLTSGTLAVLAFRPRTAPTDATDIVLGDKAKDPGQVAVGSPTTSQSTAPGGIVLESKGYVIPVHQIQVSPKVGGMVIDLFIEEGMRVKQGDILAKIEAVEYQSEYDKLSAQSRGAKFRYDEVTKYRDQETQQAKAELEEVVANRDAALKDFRRNSDLQFSRSVSPKEVEAAESAYRSLDARARRMQLALDLWIKGPRDEKIGAAKAEHEQLVAETVKAKWKLDDCTVRAPLSGTILTKKAEKGNMVNPAAFSNGLSASLCDMADLSDMEVDLAIAERDIGKVVKGQKCKVIAEAFPNRPYEGEVSRIMPLADRAKGAVPVRVKINIPRVEEGRFLRPDMGAIVTFYNKQ